MEGGSGGRLRGILDQPLWLWLLAGLILRLFLAPWFGHWNDSRIFMAVGAGVSNGESPYATYILSQLFPGVQAISHGDAQGVLFGIGYPPIWGMVLGLLYELSYATTHSLYVYMLALKLPVIAGDLAFAVVLAKLLTHISGKKSLGDYAAKIWLISPLVLLGGVIWGQFDVLPLLFILLSTYCLLKGNWLASSLLLALANGIKPLGIVLVPILAAFLWKRGSFRSALLYVASNALAFAGLSFGLLLAFGWPLGGFVASQTYQVSGVIGGGSPFILWTALSVAINGTEPYFISPVFGVLWVPVAAAVFLLYLYRESSADARSLIYWELLALTASFASRTFVNDPQFILLISLFLILLMTEPSGSARPFQVLSGLLSLFLVVHASVISFPWIESSYAVDLAQSLLVTYPGPLVKWLGSAAMICICYTYLVLHLWKLRGGGWA